MWLKKNAKNYGLRSDCIGGAANECSTRRRYPATAHRGDFWLLGFPPGPVRLSLANLGSTGYPAGPILTTSLARTSVQRGTSRHSCPHLKPSTQSDLQSSGITGARHRSRSTVGRTTSLFKCRNRPEPVPRKIIVSPPFDAAAGSETMSSPGGRRFFRSFNC